MSEQIPNQAERKEQLEALPAGHVEELLEAHYERSAAETAAVIPVQETKAEDARQVAQTIERDNPQAALAAMETEAAHQAPTPPPSQFLQKQSFKRELKTIQAKESAPTRALSKVVHQAAVQAVSETASKTVSRPSGLLGGGVAALLGSSVYLYLAYHIGFQYQPTVFIILLVTGFVIGLGIELIIRVLRAPKSTD